MYAVIPSPHHGALHDSVLAALGMEIVSGGLPTGRVITLEGVGSAHGVSRSVAREVVRVLESMGLVASRRRVGITIQPLEHWNVLDLNVIRWRLESGDRARQVSSLWELRRGFEPAAAALAARRADPQQCRVLAAAVSDMVTHGRSRDLTSYSLADKVFHQTLLASSGNEMFRALGGIVAEVVTGRAHHDPTSDELDPTAIALHDDVARAIRLRDEDGAERAMVAIIDRWAGRSVID